MEWIARYKAVFGLFTFLALLLVVYVYVIGNDVIAPSTLQFKAQHRNVGAQTLYDVIIHRVNHSKLVGKEKITHIVVQPSTTKKPVLSEFGWIKNVNFSNIPEQKSNKESDISEENMLLPPAKAKIHRRIAQLNMDWEPYSESFLANLPDLPKPKKGKYLIYLCDRKTTCGGLGDRQRGIMGLFLLALVTRRRFGIRMNSPCELDNFFSPNKINWTVNDHLLKLPFTDYINAMDDLHFKKEVGKGDFNDFHLEDVIFIRNNMDFASVLLKHKKYQKMLPEWVKSEDRWLVFSKTWKLLFKPSGILKRKLDDAMASVNTSGQRLVCAHVRIGRNPTIPGDQTIINSIHSVKRLWKFLHGYGTNASFFIASDAEQVREMAKREFGSRLITVDGEILHIDRQRDDKEVCNAFETALLEQQLLSRCDVLVISKSGFSIYASYMRASNKNLFRFEEGQITPYIIR